MANEITIPILPCRSIDDTLKFYVALGFEITYQQSKPNTYACVRRGGIELHFFVLRELEPAQSYSTCYVHAPDVDGLYQAFTAGLRQHYGKMPATGIPRITPLRNRTDGERRFNVIDPGGNWIRIGQVSESSKNGNALTSTEPAPTKLSRAINTAIVLAESKGDAAAAAKVLDVALAKNESEPPIHRVQAFVLRAGLAIAMGDQPLARKLLTEVGQIALSEADQAALSAEFQRAADLERVLQ